MWKETFMTRIKFISRNNKETYEDPYLANPAEG
jgi:hypothetical protein